MAKELTDHFVFGFHDGVDFFEPFLYGGKASDGNIVAVLKERFSLPSRGSCKWDDTTTTSNRIPVACNTTKTYVKRQTRTNTPTPTRERERERERKRLFPYLYK